MKRALICGISGQDGSYLAKFLLQKGYEVFGTSRSASASSYNNLKLLGIDDSVEIVSVSLNDLKAVIKLIEKIAPNEIYNLSGPSSVSFSYENPEEAIKSLVLGTLNLLEAIRLVSNKIRFYNASSSECFGDLGSDVAIESSPLNPKSPYAVGKSAAHLAVINYRNSYDMFACNGILFNHESNLRPAVFVTQKIVQTANRIANKEKLKLILGNTNIIRDWGWGPEYVEVMWLMLQSKNADDYIIGTGRSVPLLYFVEAVFNFYDLDWQKYLEIDPTLIRLSDIKENYANPRKAEINLGWKARYDVDDVVRFMCQGFKF